ncbi:MAG: RNA polymerase sigma factor [Anaerolineae bacterium]|nr:RNA polymerase sigma factor [Anaerolineae bacterium]
MQQESGTVSGAPAAGAALPDALGAVARDETELVRRACLGEDAAWQTLVSAHQTPVFRLAYLLLGDADEAADVAQDTFVAALRSMHRFDADRPLRPWLLRIAANTARNRRRSIGRYWAALRRTIDVTPDRTPGPDARVSLTGSEELWRAARALSAQDQEIIYLRFFLDLSLAETGAALDIPLGTVKSRLHRALERLRRVVEQEYPWLIEGLRDG